MPEITHVPDTSYAQLCTMIGHGLKTVYADADGNLYTLDTNEELNHEYGGGGA